MKSVYRKPVVYLFIASIFISAHLMAFDESIDYSKIDVQIATLEKTAGAYPPNFTNGRTKKETITLWLEVEAKLLALQKAHKDDYMVLIHLGDLYRLGHNFDIKDAWQKAVDVLLSACKLEPDQPMPHVLLGNHYAFSGRYELGIEQYNIALKLCGEEPEPEIYYGLAHAMYFLDKYKEASDNAQKFLGYFPKDKTMLVIKERADAAARGEYKPKTTNLPTPK